MTYSIGIDSGSTATKGILLADGVITRRFLVPTPFRPATAITEAWETLREGLETTPFLTLTGYGRQLVDFADKQVTFPGGDLAHAWHQRRATRQHYRKCHTARHHEYVHSVC